MTARVATMITFRRRGAYQNLSLRNNLAERRNNIASEKKKNDNDFTSRYTSLSACRKIPAVASYNACIVGPSRRFHFSATTRSLSLSPCTARRFIARFILARFARELRNFFFGNPLVIYLRDADFLPIFWISVLLIAWL